MRFAQARMHAALAARPKGERLESRPAGGASARTRMGAARAVEPIASMLASDAIEPNRHGVNAREARRPGLVFRPLRPDRSGATGVCGRGRRFIAEATCLNPRSQGRPAASMTRGAGGLSIGLQRDDEKARPAGRAFAGGRVRERARLVGRARGAYCVRRAVCVTDSNKLLSAAPRSVPIAAW